MVPFRRFEYYGTAQQRMESYRPAPQPLPPSVQLPAYSDAGSYPPGPGAYGEPYGAPPSPSGYDYEGYISAPSGGDAAAGGGYGLVPSQYGDAQPEAPPVPQGPGWYGGVGDGGQWADGGGSAMQQAGGRPPRGAAPPRGPLIEKVDDWE